MDLKLRPEHWVLLAILALCVALLALQMRQSWSFPALARLTQVIDEASPHPAPSSSSQTDPTTGGNLEEETGGGIGEPEATTEQQKTHNPPAETKASELTSAGDYLSDADALFDLMVWPESITLANSVAVVVRLQTTESPVEATFELVYDASILELIPDAHQALEALTMEQTLPEISVDAREEGRLKVRIRKQDTSPQPAPKDPQLCVLHFKPLRSAETSVRVTNGVLRLSDGKQLSSGENKRTFQIR